jgi:hypothetical protein
MRKILFFLLFCLLYVFVLNLNAERIKAIHTENNNKQVRFATEMLSPENFNSFTFFWKQPVIEKGAEMSYHLEISDGRRTGEYYIDKGLKPNLNVRSDFREEDYPNFDKLFTNKKITIVFQIDKGNMKFFDPDKYYFQFN